MAAVAACPDPVGFTSYATVNLYDETNAYYYDSPFKRTARPAQRDHYSGTTVKPGTSTPTYGHPYGQTTAKPMMNWQICMAVIKNLAGYAKQAAVIAK